MAPHESSSRKHPRRTVARVIVNAHAVARLRGGHPWIFKSDIERLDQAAPGRAGAGGRPARQALRLGALQLQLADRAAHGRANPVEAEKYPELLRYRIRQAIAYRERVVRDSDAFRVLFSEADITPGLIVDKYNDIISFQV